MLRGAASVYPSGNLTKKGRCGKPSAKSGGGVLYREGCKTCYDSARLSLPTQTDTQPIPVHLLARPVSSGERGSDRPDRPPFPHDPLPSFPSSVADHARSFHSLSPSPLEQGTPPLRILREQFCAAPLYFLTRTPHTRLPGPGRIEGETEHSCLLLFVGGDLITAGSALFSEEYMQMLMQHWAHSSQKLFSPPCLPQVLLPELGSLFYFIAV